MDYTTPRGFRDVLTQEAVERERLVRSVQDLFATHGYMPIETPTLECMDAMETGGRIPSSPFKFFDGSGELVAMRPDVTLQIARMCATRLDATPLSEPLRFRYTQRVFRDTGNASVADAREKKQIGVELIGASGPAADAEVVGLFIEALQAANVSDYTLSIATVGVLRSLLAAADAPDTWKNDVLEAFHRSNFVELDEICGRAPDTAKAVAACLPELARISGGREAIETARDLVAPLCDTQALDDFQQTYDELDRLGLCARVVVDFSILCSFDYYTGMVFQAFVDGLGSALGGGGRYDSLLGMFGTPRPAAGFAFYVEEAMAAATLSDAQPAESRPLRIAIPKGSLYKDSVAALQEAGLDTTGLEDPGRTLVVRNPGVEYIIVRPSDAPVFVETGAADCGICGKDSLLECNADTVELADLRFGSCRFIVAQLAGTSEAVDEHYRRLGTIRVATKYPNIARAHFARRGTQVEIVQLHGNIELGPLIGMAECIVDITATGTTLRENNLEITDEVLDSTARFFVNCASFRTDSRVRDLARTLRAQSANRELSVTPGGVS